MERRSSSEAEQRIGDVNIMTRTFVKVVVDIPHGDLDQLYDYYVPDDFNSTLIPGVRVRVPFGHRQSVALVWETATESDREEIKPILEILDTKPILSQYQLELCDWLAKEYISLRIDALRLFLPPGTLVASEKCWWVKLPIHEIQERLGNIEISSEALNDLIKLLEKALNDGVPIKAPKPDFVPILNILTQEDYLEAEWFAKRDKIQPKYERLLKFAGVSSELTLTPKQKKVIAQIMEQPELAFDVTIAKLCEATGVGTSVIKRLVELGVLQWVIKPVSRVRDRYGENNTVVPAPTEEQKRALEEVLPGISQGGFQSFLLHGVTGSGKTEVYLRLLDSVIREGKQGVFLVPEISLTPQTLERVRQRLGQRVAIFHSRLSDGERYDQWWRIRNGEVDVVVGARSALFAPLERIGLIILDEEHEYSYKQEEAPRYQTRDVARKICQRLGATLLLGSATPSMESWYAAEQGSLTRLRMSQRVADRTMPTIAAIDMRQELQDKHYGVLSRPLRTALTETFDQGHQAILLLNRRGFATFVMCRECGKVLQCKDCDVSLTFHQRPPLMKCHYCGYQEKPPDICPHCRSRYIRFFGQGTQRLEDEVRELFPTARVARMDVDTTSRRGAHEDLYKDLKERRIDILVGTQMVAKGLDLPNVTLVGVIAADATLHFPDFRSAERTYQLLTQVSGRSGRGEAPGHVIIQTYNPEHYCIASVIYGEEEAFYQRELATRQEAGYPPFSSLIRVGFSGPVEQEVIGASEAFSSIIDDLIVDRGLALDILGPAPAAVERIQGRVRWQVVLRSLDPSALREIVSEAKDIYRRRSKSQQTRLSFDVNPYSLI